MAASRGTRPDRGRSAPGIRGLLFDKDGTLFDFQATWGPWAAGLVLDLAGGDAAHADVLADMILLDRAAQRFHPASPVVAGTPEDAAAALVPGLTHADPAALVERIVRDSVALAPVEAVPLRDLLAGLRNAGFFLGIATNDAEAVAVGQLQILDLLPVFDIVIGADSGHGAKPAPGQCLAFAEAVSLPPREIAMVGDSTHDLHAGRAAGMTTIAVLTGLAAEDQLAPHADVVLPDIGHLPAWLGIA